MPRNGSGVYTLPAGNPVVPGTTIDAAWANSTLNDIANELTNSLSRTGAGGMIAPFRIADGNITAPGLSFLNETGSGLYRSGAGSVWMSILGTNTMQFATTAVTVASSRTFNALGNALVGGTLGVTGATTLASTLAVTGALTATGGVLGNITAASGTSTFHDVLINGSLDMAVGSSATITGLSTPTNASDAANKGYVDTQDALRLALTGGTMSGAIAMGANKITGLGTPSADTDAANKAYVDSVAQGLDIKASVRAATTTNISLSGAQTIDGVAVIAGDRVLVKNQSSAADNGIYVASASTWARASDANTWDKLVGAFTFVEDGSTNDNSGWVCAIAPGGTLGVTAVTWEQFSGAGQITAGAGLTKTGNTLNVGTASSARIVVGADEIDLAQTGVSAGTYKSVTVDLFGRVTAGTNPTTLAGYGITDAYTNTQTDTLLNGKLSLTGGTMTGALAMGTNRITGMGDPVNAQDAATKNYIDTIFGSTSSAAASAAAAASSASAASTSASNASTSASNASSSASAAAASAASAAASYDSFDDRYLGAKSSDPTVDNDGNALITGALYWNTVGNIMKTWTGTAWVSSINPISMPDGTVNGVAYLNGSKVLTTSSGFTYDGSSLTMSSSSSYYPQIVTRNKANDNTATYYGFDKDRNGAVVQNGDVLGNLVFRGYDGTQYLQGAYINAVVNATPGANDMPGALCFGVTPDGSAGPSEGMRLTSTGLGVGTSSPASKLHVVGQGGNPPASSGTTQTGNYARLQNTGSGLTLDVGGWGGNGNWLQSTNTSDLSLTYPLLLNPNGGNVGIGTSSPAQKLDVVGTIQSQNNAAVNDATVGAYNFLNSNSNAAANPIRASIVAGRENSAWGAYLDFYTSTGTSAQTAKMRLDTAGNLGLGVPPSAWDTGSSRKAFDISTYGGLTANTSAIILAANTFNNGSGWVYKLSDAASMYRQTGGSHAWFSAASGTAGNPFTFTQAMTLDSSGRLLVGVTSASGNAGFQLKGASSGYVRLEGTSSTLFAGDASQLISGAAAQDSAVRAEAALLFAVGGGTERARITSGGNLLVGTTANSPGYGNTNTGAQLSATQSNFSANSVDWVMTVNQNGSDVGSRYFVSFRVSNSSVGNITSNGTTTFYNTTSDYRLKTLAGEVTGSGARIDALNPVEFDWNVNGQRDRGFFAHQFQAVYPNSVTGSKDAVDANGNPVYQGMQAGSSEVIADLVAEIQSLRARVAALESNP